MAKAFSATRPGGYEYLTDVERARIAQREAAIDRAMQAARANRAEEMQREQWQREDVQRQQAMDIRSQERMEDSTLRQQDRAEDIARRERERQEALGQRGIERFIERQQRLEDVAGERAWREGLTATEREQRLEDVTGEREYQEGLYELRRQQAIEDEQRARDIAWDQFLKENPNWAAKVEAEAKQIQEAPGIAAEERQAKANRDKRILAEQLMGSEDPGMKAAGMALMRELVPDAPGAPDPTVVVKGQVAARRLATALAKDMEDSADFLEAAEAANAVVRAEVKLGRDKTDAVNETLSTIVQNYPDVSLEALQRFRQAMINDRYLQEYRRLTLRDPQETQRAVPAGTPEKAVSGSDVLGAIATALSAK
jgi:hypothetical protein